MNHLKESAEISEEDQSLYQMVKSFYDGQTVYAININGNFFFFLDSNYIEQVHKEFVSIHDIADISGNQITYVYDKIKLLCQSIGLTCKLALDPVDKKIHASIISRLTNGHTLEEWTVESFSISITTQYNQS